MLVLSRKECERIVIGDQIVVTVVALDGGRVKLGIEAPSHIGIRRAELALRPSASNSPRVDDASMVATGW